MTEHLCKICGEPAGPLVDGADVYHMDCLMDRMEHLRARERGPAPCHKGAEEAKPE